MARVRCSWVPEQLPTLFAAAPAGHYVQALDFVADLLVEGGVGQENQAVRAGVRVGVLVRVVRAEYGRVLHVNTSDVLAGSGTVPTSPGHLRYACILH